MKKVVCLLCVCFFLTACASEETFETISDELVLDVASPLREVLIALPEEAVMPVSETDTGAWYHCGGYELMLQTLPGGDLDATLQAVSGYTASELTLIRTTPGDYKRCDLVWSCMGEQGEQVGRAAVLDDGHYHYVLSVLTDAESAGQCSEAWEDIFSSYALGSY